MSLLERLVRDIREDGPMTVADYMTRCLHDPLDGYYATHPALGAEGDFITAPLVSQMFGEMLGAWTHEVWLRLGSPTRLRLVELGPGTGVLMTDVLRTARGDPAFAAACEPWFVETSRLLQERQTAAVPGARWVERLGEVPMGAPTVILANEFLDCLPVSQLVASTEGWRERRVGLTDDGALGYVDGAICGSLSPLEHSPPGSVWEWSRAAALFAAELGERLTTDPGAALFIDYGRAAPGSGDTLQAVRQHRKEHPLANPGSADLTAHVDFPSFAEAARRAGADVASLETQGDFLLRLGIAHRAATLRRASPGRADAIGRQLDRLVSSDGMGALFKVLAVTSPGLAPP